MTNLSVGHSSPIPINYISLVAYESNKINESNYQLKKKHTSNTTLRSAETMDSIILSLNISYNLIKLKCMDFRQKKFSNFGYFINHTSMTRSFELGAGCTFGNYSTS